MMVPFDFHTPHAWIRLIVILVWLLFGLLFKALGFLPRHRAIVARVVGDRAAGTVLSLVAIGEITIAAWMIYGRFLIPCVAVQTVFIFAMNVFELRYARDLLVSPVGMVCANILFLAAGWYVALAS